jgi:isopenicillin N synthase-like dioxygenase
MMIRVAAAGVRLVRRSPVSSLLGSPFLFDSTLRRRTQTTIATTTTTTTTTTNGGTMSVPIVDLSQPAPVVGKAIHDACTRVGFFNVVHHGVSPDLLQSVLEEGRAFFDGATTLDEKDRISIRHSESVRGYQRMGENWTGGMADAHEALDFFSESDRAALLPNIMKHHTMPNDNNDHHDDAYGRRRRRRRRPTNYGRNQWPDPSIYPHFRPVMERYVQEMTRVGARLMQGCALGLDLKDPNYFHKYFDDPFWILRLIHYPSTIQNTTDLITNDRNNKGETIMGCGEHTDYGMFTLIWSEKVPKTLQIRTGPTTTNTNAADNEWIFIEPLEGAFLCNVGDMLSIWTNGMYRSTPHRVMRPGGGMSRVSCPFFYEPSYDAVIAPIDDLVQRSNQPPSFQPIRYGDHLLSKTSSNFVLEQSLDHEPNKTIGTKT